MSLLKAKHQRLARRFQVKSDDVPKPLFELRVIREFEGLLNVRLDLIGSPNPLHARVR